MIGKIVDKIADRIRWGYLLAFILLLCSYILSYYTTKQLFTQVTSLNNSNYVINNLDILQSTVEGGESALGDYLIIKDKRFLDSYNNSLPVIDSLQRELRILTRRNPVQSQNFDLLNKFVKEKYVLISLTLANFLQHDKQVTDSIKTMGYKGKQKMDDINNLMQKMQNQEHHLMVERLRKLSSFSNVMKVINFSSLLIAILLTIYSVVTFTKENQAKKQADHNSKVFREQLEIRVGELARVNQELLGLRNMEKFAVTGRISRTIAHEVRNPLTNIYLAAEHLRSEIQPTEETDLLLEMITRNGNRINLLISDLLNTTKITQLDYKKVSLNDILDESLQLAQDRLELKGVEVIKEYTPDLCDVLGDLEKLRTAFLNIIVNAVEAMEPDMGILRIKTENKNDGCRVVIKDNGKGMSKEHLSKLFEPYFTTKENGTGLGLAHTQNIIISHKATILAESEVGTGSAFTVSLKYA